MTIRIGSRAVIGSGTLVLLPGDSQVDIPISDFVVRVIFLGSGGPPGTEIKVGSAKVLEIYLSNFQSPLGTSSIGAFANNGNPFSYAIVVHSIGDNPVRSMSFTFSAGDLP
ncbi:hypothetical protein OSH10_08355 [Kaistia defluvii]|uniref:DUF6864 domain-containing function n=1 Tax=Kaistia defluvii TaxID=410841 RepID=UPI00224F4CB5|nr:hypothetical protein [Kaistia defluvii]MCX5518445.1 hypothetical protein [Kaistia defluvii]